MEVSNLWVFFTICRVENLRAEVAWREMFISRECCIGSSVSLLPLSFAVQVLCSLRLEWLYIGRRTLKSLSLSSWPKASAAVFFYTDKFCCKICLRFLKNANKKLEIHPNRMLCFYEMVWRDVSVTVIQTQLQEANVAGERKTEDTLPHLQVFCPLSQAYFLGYWNSLSCLLFQPVHCLSFSQFLREKYLTCVLHSLEGGIVKNAEQLENRSHRIYFRPNWI